jgi:hypothetical protein
MEEQVFDLEGCWASSIARRVEGSNRTHRSNSSGALPDMGYPSQSTSCLLQQLQLALQLQKVFYTSPE